MTAYDSPGAQGAADAGNDVAYDAVVLAGGAARRLGGADKPAVRVGGRALLDRVLAACADARTTVVVADPRPTARPVTWAREDPPGGGPLAALDAGLRYITAERVVVLSADLPFLDEGTVRRLLAALRTSGADGALLTDAGGRDQPLVAAYRASALRRELAALARGHDDRTRPEGDGRAGLQGDGRTGPGEGGQTRPGEGGRTRPGEGGRTRPEEGGRTGPEGDGRTGPHGGGRTRPEGGRRTGSQGGGLTGLPLRRLTGALELTRVPDPVASFDCDTWDDIATARARIREHGHVLDEWISAVKDELGIDLDVDTKVLLDLARDAAHGVARPAAPLTTFLVGYAAARAKGGEGGPEAVAEASRKAAALAVRWADEAAAAKPDAAPDATPDTTRPDAG